MAVEAAGPAGTNADAGAQALRGFLLADSVAFDQAEYDKYRAAVSPSVEGHGGSFFIRGGRFERLEGEREWHRLIGVMFPSFDVLREWYATPLYQSLKAQRLKGAHTDMLHVEETRPSGAPAGTRAPLIAGPEPEPPPPGTPPAYVIAGFEIHDLEAVRPYVEGVAATHAGHGSRYLSRGGRLVVAEGAWHPSRLIVIEFPSWDAARGWYFGDAYQALARTRRAGSSTDMVLVEGWGG